MYFTQENFLSPEQLEHFRALIAKMPFVDGRGTNPTTTVKENLEADARSPDYRSAAKLLSEIAFANDRFMEFAMPCKMTPPLIAKYHPGMNYGDHIDSPMMPGQPPTRTDVSATVFINDPEDYEGGELRIRLGTESISFKGKAGSIVSYPTTALHGVQPVTKGERLVVVTFFQSRIRDPLKREILQTLVRLEVEERSNLSQDGQDKLDYIRSNLIRRWMEL